MRFIDNNNGTITDTQTGLMWQKETASEMYAWDDALKYCKALDLAGHKDWRLPTLDELRNIVDRTRYDPAIDPIFKSASSYYWSASTNVSDPYYAWLVFFRNGGVSFDHKTVVHYVRAVRSGP